MIKKVIKSHFFNFKHYYDESGVHIFSTELIDGIEKRIDKDLAMKFDLLAEEDYYLEKAKKTLLKQNEHYISNAASRIKENSNLDIFKYHLNYEIKRITNNKLTISDLTAKQVEKYYNFSRNNTKKEFSV